MISLKSEFKLSDRGFKDSLVLIPGWAADYRIFATLDLNYNYLVPLKSSPFTFHEDLQEALNKNSLDKVSLFGWSMGGFLAADFALRNIDRINELFLLSICRRFKRRILEGVKSKVKENAQAYLNKFYSEWFSPWDKEAYLRFKKHLLRNYLGQLQFEGLLSGLDYLMQAQINPKALNSLQKIKIFHGKEDKIAPFKEALKIKSAVPRAEFVSISHTGHAPFLRSNFKEIFYNGQSEGN